MKFGRVIRLNFYADPGKMNRSYEFNFHRCDSKIFSIDLCQTGCLDQHRPGNLRYGSERLVFGRTIYTWASGSDLGDGSSPHCIERCLSIHEFCFCSESSGRRVDFWGVHLTATYYRHHGNNCWCGDSKSNHNLRPLKNVNFCSSSRKTKNLTAGIYGIFRR